MVVAMTQRLSREDWIEAGFRALVEAGPGALKAEPLARRLGSSKGSFYWHFKDVPDFRAAMLAHWNEKAHTGIIDGLAGMSDPRARLSRLADLASSPAEARYGGARVEMAIRAWSLEDENVAAAVDAVDTGRIAYLESLLEECGRPAGLALVVYGAYVGLDDLAGRGRADAAAAFRDLVARILD